MTKCERILPHRIERGRLGIQHYEGFAGLGLDLGSTPIVEARQAGGSFSQLGKHLRTSQT
jgi:hypothetical protein